LRRWLPLHPYPTAWDHLFSKLESGWVRVQLRDGSRVGGRWEAGAFAGTSPTGRDLLLVASRQVQLDGSFGPEGAGEQWLLIREAEIGLIEVFPDVHSQEDKREQETNRTRLSSNSGARPAGEGQYLGRISAGAGEEGLFASSNDNAPPTAAYNSDVTARRGT